MADTHINVFVREAQEARAAIDGALEDFKQKVAVVRAKFDQLEPEAASELEKIVKGLEAEVKKLEPKTGGSEQSSKKDSKQSK